MYLGGQVRVHPIEEVLETALIRVVREIHELFKFLFEPVS
jgi:hypothetical protein